MTPLAWSWLLSLTGAVLFFAAGAAFRLRRLPDVQFAERDALERELTQRTAERQQLFRELEIERSARLTPSEQPIVDTSGVTDSKTAGLRHELALIQDQLSRRETQLAQLRDENIRLRALEEDLGHSKRELAVLHEQTRVLRAQAFVSTPPRPRTPTPTLSTTGRALQTIVDTETRLGRAKSAVIADELGLLVAASGATNEYNDALAALGAYLADVGTKTRDILPLRKLRQVIVCDDHNVILTVRPLATEDHGLALVTLAVEPASSANDTRQN